MKIDLKARFRPRADAGLLPSLVREAWSAKQAELTSQQVALGVPEAVAAHLEARFSVADMQVLKNYGVAKEITSIGVRAYNAASKRWDCVVPVELPRPVLTPGAWGLAEVHAGGPRWSKDLTRGCRPEEWAKMPEAERAEITAYQDGAEKMQLPESVEPFFAAVVAARVAYHDECRQTIEWPAQVKSESGDYPTWGAILAKFPVLGAYVKAQVA